MKATKKAYPNPSKALKILDLKASILREQKLIWHCELVIAACAGASLALVGVIAHMMIAGEAWTW
jgi:hypothetical protein